ncbi:MAG: ATP-binding protein [Spirochaetales bacterium]|nr:ATP-binding protein [Leptospiraceae bacterium]MCP5480238.1 ATP-binding protein [Spirochaetales bacterium]MCP5486363.1 ATP-binding protein [Spirochaetales bacterium]
MRLKESESTADQAQIRIFDEMMRDIRSEAGPPRCLDCLDLGILYYRDEARSAGFGLCHCQQAISRCDGRPPFEYYDEKQKAMVPCPSRPARIALKRVLLLESRSGIPSRFRGKFLDDINQSDPYNPSLSLAVGRASSTVVQFGQKSAPGLYLWGGTGCGKTLTSCAVLNELLRIRHSEVRYAKISRDILGKLRASFNPNSEIYGEGKAIEEELATVPALVIDDFGVHRETAWVNQVLYDLIDARYEHGLLTIITSNEPMESWREISGGRIYSRLRQMTTEIEIDAPDYRLRTQGR